jgi:hypothetical protein
MTTNVARVDLKRATLLAVALAVPAARNAIAQQNINGVAQQSIISMSPMAADAHPSFEVATIKPADPNQLKGNFRIGGHRIYIENQSVDSLLSVAYAIHQKQIVGGPAWLDTQRYDIVGQPDVEGVPNLHQIQEMLQELLESRFYLTFHREKRELSIYAITVAKGGPKLAKSANSSSHFKTKLYLPASPVSSTTGLSRNACIPRAKSDIELLVNSHRCSRDRPPRKADGKLGEDYVEASNRP